MVFRFKIFINRQAIIKQKCKRKEANNLRFVVKRSNHRIYKIYREKESLVSCQ